MVRKQKLKKFNRSLHAKAFSRSFGGLPATITAFGTLFMVGLSNAQEMGNPSTTSPDPNNQSSTPADLAIPNSDAVEPDGSTASPDDIIRDRRFSFSEDEMAETLFRWGSFSLHPGAGYGVSYNDNIFAGRTSQNSQIKSKDDILHRFVLDIAGSYFTGDMGDVSIPLVNYSPEYLLYTKNSDRNAINQSGSLRVLKELPKTSIALEHASSSRQDVFAETATNERQTSHNTALVIHYELGGKTKLESETSQRFLDSSNFLETKEWRQDFWINYELRPKVALAAGTSGGYAMVSEGGNSWVHADQLRLTWFPTAKLSFSLRGGYEWRFAADEEARDQDGFIAGVSANYLVARATTLSFSAERTFRPSIYQVNETPIYNSVSLILRQQFSAKFFGSLVGGYSHVEYDSSNGGGGTPMEGYDFYSSQMEVGYSITKRASSSVFYRRIGRSTGAGLGNFTSNEVGLNLNYHY